VATIKALTQGLAPNHDHEEKVKQLLQHQWANSFFISVAFVTGSGVGKIAHELAAKNSNVEMFIGISNGITSKQALDSLLAIGVLPIAVDMGTQTNIFHPKLYAAIGNEQAQVILGSANLTASGLNGNVELSSLVDLLLIQQGDADYLNSLLTPFRALISKYPQNVFPITTSKQIDDLLLDGRLEDEATRSSAPTTGAKSSQSSAAAIPALPTHRGASQFPSPQSVPRVPVPRPHIPSPQNKAVPLGLIWSSKPLSERDLNIPTGSNTNATGSMYFKKGLLVGIDQRHYFKDVVFDSLTWVPDTKASKKHLLRAVADFEIIVNGISNGVYSLDLTHNSSTNTKTYRQNNAMTQVHWGAAKPIIAQKGLLNKHMSLYHLGGSSYQMEIT
jgi:HKD family nuclease